MKGYTVITSDEKKAGHVVDEHGEYLIVEHGTLRKTRRPLPRAFAHTDDAEQIVRATVPSGVLNEAPDIGDDEAIARHYGLAEPDPDPVTHGEATSSRATRPCPRTTPPSRTEPAATASGTPSRADRRLWDPGACHVTGTWQ